MLEKIKNTAVTVKPYVEVIAARVLNHPGEQLAISILASKLVFSPETELLADVNMAYAISNFVYYVASSPLYKIKGMIKTRDENVPKDFTGVASCYVAGNGVCIFVAVCSLPVLMATSTVLKLNPFVQNCMYVFCANNYLALNNTMDRQTLQGFKETLYSLFSSTPYIALTIALSVKFVPESGLVGFAYASLVGLSATNILNKLYLAYLGKFVRSPNFYQVKSDIWELLNDGAPNCLSMLIEMSSLTVFPYLALLLGPEYASAAQIAVTINAFASAISQGITTVAGRDAYVATGQNDQVAVKRIGNRAAIASSAASAASLVTFSIFARRITGAFTSDTKVQDIAAAVIPLVSAAESVSNVRQSLANTLRMGFNDNWWSTGASAISAAIFIGIGIGLRNSQKLDFDSGIFLGCMLLNLLLVAMKYAYRTCGAHPQQVGEAAPLLASDRENTSTGSESSPNSLRK